MKKEVQSQLSDMKKAIAQYSAVILLSLLPTFAIWLPFFLRIPVFWHIPLPRQGLATIIANYDGPLYIVVAKTLYNKELIQEMFSFNLPSEYYAAHFPLFPALIKAFSSIGYPYAMLAVTLTSSILAFIFFYKLAKQYVTPQNALWLTALFAIFPARWLIVRSVGSPEPLFLAAIIASVFYFKNKKYFWAGVWGAIAQLTKSPGILLFVAYAGYLFFPRVKDLATSNFTKWVKNFEFRAWPIIFIPAALIGVFVTYGILMNDFLAYFHSGDNIHLFFPPFQIFNYSAPWVDTHWLEEIIFIYLIGSAGIIKLIKKKETLLAWFTGVFFATLLFVSHRDIIRYGLPIVPFLYIAFSKYLTKSETKWIFALLILPIYLFSLAFISKNTMPISHWSPFL